MAAITTAAANKICKIYIVLHGNGVRAQDEEFNKGEEGSDNEPNFFTLGDGLPDSVVDIKLFRMVAPGMVFMSHIDINQELREKLLTHPLDNWLNHLKINPTLTPQQIAAAAHQDKVDPEGERWLKSRAIFRQLLQLFNKGDRLTNERLMTDLGKKGGSTGEHLKEFGVWICEGAAGDWRQLINATDGIITGQGEGKEVELTLEKLISHIVTQSERGPNCTDYEFYIANCSPIPTDKRDSIGRLQRQLTASKWSRPGQFSAVALKDDAENTNFWLNTLYIHYNRLKMYHQGKESLNSLINNLPPNEQQTGQPQVPATDTIWGMMDSEERQDHYKLINGLLHMYPFFIRDFEVDKREIKEMMLFIIKTITTPFNETIRCGEDFEKGASQITKYGESNGAGGAGASKDGHDQKGYYTLSHGVASKIAAVITGEYVIPGLPADSAQEILSDYKEMLQSVYGMGLGEIRNNISRNYPFKPSTNVSSLKEAASSSSETLNDNNCNCVERTKKKQRVKGGGKIKRKKRTKRKKRKKKKRTRRKKKKRKKKKTRRRKKRTKRKK